MLRDITVRVVAGVVVVLLLFAIGKIFGIALIGAAVVRKVAKS